MGVICLMCNLLNNLIKPIICILVYSIVECSFEISKFLLVLIITYGLAYCAIVGPKLLMDFLDRIPLQPSTPPEGEEQIPHNTTGEEERLSAGLIDHGSFSKFPYVVDLPSKLDRNRE